jgi:hypothetical protein
VKKAMHSTAKAWRALVFTDKKLNRQHGFALSAMEKAGAPRLSSTLADTFPPGELALHLRSAHEIPPLELLQSAAKKSRNTIEDKEGHFVA